MTELYRPEVGIVAYAFGADPGNPINRSLADLTAGHYRDAEVKPMVAAQDEVAENLQGRIPSEHLIPVGRDHSVYLDTADIAVEALLGLQGCSELLVAAQGLHAHRAAIWTRRLASGIDIAKVSLLPSLPRGYAPDDPQDHVHSMRSFLPREIVALAASPVFLGKARKSLSGQLARQAT